MKYSIVLTPTADSHEIAVRAENLGFYTVWFFDSPLLYTDIFVSMALAAARTTRITLGTAVVVPTNRIAPVTANAIASLNAVAPGRIILGVGTGFSGRNTMGKRPVRVADMINDVNVVRSLLDGRDVVWTDPDGAARIQFLHDGPRFAALTPRVPIWISGMGPRTTAVAAELGDGWLAFAPGAEHAVQYLTGITAAVRDRGHDSFPRTIMSTGCVLEDGERADSARAIATAGPLAAVFYHNVVEGSLDFALPEHLAHRAADYREKVYLQYEPADARHLELHRGHLTRVRDDERPFVDAELVRSTSFTGTRDELRAVMEQLEAAGCTEFAIQLVAGHEEEIERWAELFGLKC